MGQMNNPPQPPVDRSVAPDPLRVGQMLGPTDRLYAFLRVRPNFEMPLRDVDPSGKPLGKWCGLHALWLICHHIWPEKWNVPARPPGSAKSEEILGLNVPDSLAFTALRVGRAPSYFAHHGAKLHVDGAPVLGYLDFVRRIALGWVRRPRAAEGVGGVEDEIIDLVKKNVPVAIDLRLPGLLRFREHALFVYGVCHSGFVVIDSVVVRDLGYRKLTPLEDPRLIMLLPFEEFRRRWGRGSSVWHVLRDGGRGQRIN